MWLSSLRRLVYGNPRTSKKTRSVSYGRRIAPKLEHLEDRTLLSNYTTGVFTDGVTGAPNNANSTLRDAIIAANADIGTATDTIQLSAGTYTLNDANNNLGDLSITNTSHSLIIQGATNTDGTPATIIDQKALTRVFQIVNPGTTVQFENVIIEGGDARDNGGVGSTPAALGGGLLSNGGNVTMTNVAFMGDAAVGGAGQSAQGGGIYSAGGSVALSNVTFNRGGVAGGVGTVGSGGTGGNAQGGAIYASGATLTLSGGLVENINVLAGNGMAGASSKASGGNAGVAQGGGVYIKSGSLTLTNGVSVTGNQLNVLSNQYGVGGKGGVGGAGGKGGDADGGGVYATQSSVTVINATISGNAADAGNGGNGGSKTNAPLAGGNGGNGGNAQGGGLYVNGGSGLTITGANTTIASNHATAGIGGNGGVGGDALPTGPNGGAGGAGGEADGGGIYVNGAPVAISGGTSQTAQTVVFNVASGGPGGAGGHGGNAHLTNASHNGGVAGNGGNGGLGGQGQGGGLFVTGTGLSVTLGNATTTATFDHNTATGGQGGGQGGGYAGLGNQNGGINDNGLGGNGGAGADGAVGDGGGVSILGNNTLTLTNVAMQSNTVAGGPGGRGGNNGGNGTAGLGGNGGNAASGMGAGLYVSGSSNTTVLNSTLSDNIGFGAEGGNGGVSGKSRTGFIGNSGGNGGNAGIIQGGAFYAANSTVAVLNSTLADNQIQNGLQGFGGTGQKTGSNGVVGAAQGGGLFATGGNLTLTNATVAWNFLYLPFGSAVPTDLGAGVYNDTTNTLKIQNTIIALDQLYSNSSTPTSTPSDLFGSATSSDHDFIGDGTGSNLVNGTNGDQVGTDTAPLDPQFTAPQPTYPANGQEPSNNGGLTPTLVLNWGSTAINAGDPSAAAAIATAEGFTDSSSATDQRGQPRVIDGTIDIGATETQLILSGNAPATVTAGSTITYTLTVANNESTAVGVTLTDATPANTTFQSFTAPSGWTTTSAPSMGATGTVTANTASLAPNTTATFTLVVTVDANTAGNTVIANMPSISTTATAPAVSFTRGITLDTTVPGATTTDITSSVFLRESPVFPAPEDGPNDFAQAVFLINTSGETINGPVALVLNGLPAGVTLLNANGTYNGSPYIDILPSGGSWKAGWRHFVLPFLHFNNPDNVKISYTAQIIEGI
jgi:uncharacterized repeat protein (TIGR01451 family)